MAVSVADQALIACTVSTGGVAADYLPFAILPAASTAADLAVRDILRHSGYLRRVTDATAAPDFTTAAAALGAVVAAREAASAGATAGKPVVMGAGGLPVVANY